ncbi:MAG: hypothetical protein AB7G88_15905 [Thermomicrobiales bacterium]
MIMNIMLSGRGRKPLGLRFAIALAALLAFSAQYTIAAQEAATPVSSLVDNYVEAATREGLTAEGFEVEITLAAPEFLEAMGRAQEAVDLGADEYLVFVVVRRHHGALDDAHAEHEHWGPFLRVDGKSIHVASETRLLGDDGHNRTNAFIFADLPATMLQENHSYELVLPPGDDGVRPSMTWFSPLLPDTIPATPAPVATPES